MLEDTVNVIIKFKEQLEEYTKGITGVPSDVAENHWQRCVPYTGIRGIQEKKDQIPK